MRSALGISVHTGWAVCVIAGGNMARPRIELRERIQLLGDAERFVFHRAAEMKLDDAKAFVAQVRGEGRAAAVRALRQVVAERELAGCAIVAGAAEMPPLAQVVASHPMIHTAEGLFHRDVLRAAAEAVGLSVRIVTPKSLDPKSAQLAAVGRAVGKPWNNDVKLGTLAAWAVLGPARS